MTRFARGVAGTMLVLALQVTLMVGSAAFRTSRESVSVLAEVADLLVPVGAAFWGYGAVVSWASRPKGPLHEYVVRLLLPIPLVILGLMVGQYVLVQLYGE